MSAELNRLYAAYKNRLMSAIRVFPQWSPEFEDRTDKMVPAELESLADQLFLAQKGGGLLRRDYVQSASVTRVLPDGKLVAPKFDWGVRYDAIPYHAEFRKRAAEEAELGVIHTYGPNTVTAEVLGGERQNNRLLICREINNRSTVAEYEAASDGKVRLSRVGFDFGYLTGAYSSHPSLFMPVTRRATALDALFVYPPENPDAAARAQFKYNGSGYAYNSQLHDDGSMRVQLTNDTALFQIDVLTEGDDFVMRLHQDGRSLGSPVLVPLRGSVSMDPSQIRLGQQAHVQDGYIDGLDTFVKSLEAIAPRAGIKQAM